MSVNVKYIKINFLSICQNTFFCSKIIAFNSFLFCPLGEKDGVIPGNVSVVDPKKQFKPLSAFGNAFLNRFQCSMLKSPVLKGMTIIDTPGILAGNRNLYFTCRLLFLII